MYTLYGFYSLNQIRKAVKAANYQEPPSATSTTTSTTQEVKQNGNIVQAS